jgi:hypothetical protein
MSAFGLAGLLGEIVMSVGIEMETGETRYGRAPMTGALTITMSSMRGSTLN